MIHRERGAQEEGCRQKESIVNINDRRRLHERGGCRAQQARDGSPLRSGAIWTSGKSFRDDEDQRHRGQSHKEPGHPGRGLVDPTDVERQHDALEEQMRSVRSDHVRRDVLARDPFGMKRLRGDKPIEIFLGHRLEKTRQRERRV